MTIKQFAKSIGPGLMMAGAAIGVSHLVQSTRAGANFGWELLIVVLIANFFKYPFFEIGHRFTTATQKNLLEGYSEMPHSKTYLRLFFVLNVISAVIAIAAVTLVTALLVQDLFSGNISAGLISLGILLFCFLLITIGRYQLLDSLMKVMMVVLVLCVSTAFGYALMTYTPPVNPPVLEGLSWANLAFLIALMGWMPAPIEISVWQSLWIQSKAQNNGHTMSPAEGKWDFNFGYILTIVMAIVFLGLGATLMFGRGAEFSASSAGFAKQLLEMCTHGLGPAFKPVVTAAAIAAMFSTTLTLFDAYPRSLHACFELIRKEKTSKGNSHFNLKDKCIWLGTFGALAIFVIFALVGQLKTLVDLATTVAFLAAPFFAYLNYKLVFNDSFPKEHKPNQAFQWLAKFGLCFLTIFSAIYVYYIATK